MTILWTVIGILFLAVVYLWIKLYSIENEKSDTKYLIVEKTPDGGMKIKDTKGQIVLEL